MADFSKRERKKEREREREREREKEREGERERLCGVYVTIQDMVAGASVGCVLAQLKTTMAIKHNRVTAKEGGGDWSSWSRLNLTTQEGFYMVV